MRLLIRGCDVLDPSQPMGRLASRHIAIEGNRIADVSSSLPAGAFDRELDARDTLAIPGLINAHTHSPENLLRATTDRLPLEPWLIDLFGICGDYDPRDIYLCVLLGAKEMLLTGTTAVVDHLWFSPAITTEGLDAAMQAYRDSGMRAAVAPLYDDEDWVVRAAARAGFPLDATWFGRRHEKRPPLGDTLGLLRDWANRWHNSDGGRLRCFVGPAGVQWCSERLLHESLGLVRGWGGGLHMHLLETQIQAQVCRERFGVSAAEWMGREGLLGPDVSLPHSVHLTDDDLDAIAEHGACVVHNPAANLRLGSGLAPIRRMIDRGIPIALGCDGAASNDNQVTFEAVKLAALIHNPSESRPDRWISSREALGMAWTGGASVLGLRESLGRIAPGQLADIVLLDAHSPLLTPLNDACHQLAYCENGHSVRTVIVDGRIAVEDGHVLTFDADSVGAEIRERLRSRPDTRLPRAEVERVRRMVSEYQQYAVRTEGRLGADG